jgi:hypothetical protein
LDRKAEAQKYGLTAILRLPADPAPVCALEEVVAPTDASWRTRMSP